MTVESADEVRSVVAAAAVHRATEASAAGDARGPATPLDPGERTAQVSTWRAGLVDALQDGFFAIDAAGRVVEVNDAFEQILGYGAPGVPYAPPHPWWADRHAEPGEYAAMRAASDEALRSGCGRWVLPLRHRDGHRVWADVAVDTVPDATGTGAVLVGVLRDVTSTHLAADRAQRLAALAAALTGTQTAEDVAAVLIEHLRAAVGGETCSLRAVLEGRASRILRVDGTPAGYGERFGELDLGVPSALAELVATQSAVFVASAQDNRARYGACAVPQHEAAGIEALARLPLLVQDQLIGVLSIGYRQAQEFAAEKRQFLTTVADLAAQALDRALRSDRLRRDAARATRLGELAAALATTVGVQEVGAVLAEHVQRAVNADAFSLRTPDLHSGVARTLHAAGAAIDGQPRFAEIPLDVPSALAEAVATRRPMFVGSAEESRSRYGREAAERYEALHVEAMARFPLLVEGELVAVLSVGYWQPREFDEPERLFLTTVADLAAQALGRAMRTERLRAEARRHRLLSAAQEAVNRRLDPTAQLRALARVVVPELADLSTVHVLAIPVPPGAVPPLPVVTDRVAAHTIEGVEPPPASTGLQWGAGAPIVEAIRRGRLTEQISTPDVPEWARSTGTTDTFQSGLNRVVLAPVLAEGLVVAVVAFGTCHDRPAWDEQDLAILADVAGYAAVAVEHGLSYQHTRHTALVLQRSLLGEPPTLAGLQVCARYRPAGRDEIGGDWYDAFETSPGSVALTIGDVMGHDIAAAAAMGQLRAALRALALNEAMDPGAVLERLAAVNGSLRTTGFATAIFARLLRVGGGGDWELCWAAAGHPPPMVVEPRGRARPLEHTGGMALVPGFAPLYPSARRRLRSGSTLLLYTDGLVERRGATIDAGIAELCARAGALADRPLDDMCEELLRDAPVGDDIALLAVRAAMSRPDGSGLAHHSSGRTLSVRNRSAPS